MRTLLIVLMCLPLFVFSQDGWQTVEATEFIALIRDYEKAIPSNESYALETRYRIYNDYRDSEPVTSFDGKLTCKNGKVLNVRQMENVMVQDETLNITIDTVAKQLMLQNPDPSFFYRKTLNDYASFLETAEQVYKRSQNSNHIYQLKLKPGNPYASMEFMFSDHDHLSQIIIYSHQPYFVENEAQTSARAKIVLDFSKIKKGKTVITKQFLEISEIVLIKDTLVTPIGRYKDFELIDLRN